MTTLKNKKWSIVWLFFLLATSSGLAQENASRLRVMSFNIRFGAAPDGENHWDHRHENVLTTIQEFEPDLLGTQEVLRFQARYLQENLTGFHYVGRSRENSARGEQCGVLVKKSRFDILEQGHFWLSETPNVPASKSWDSSLPRMATWVKLFDREHKSSVYFLNTHFDHRGRTAREKSAKVIVEKLTKFDENVPVIVAGDFNTGPESKPYLVLTDRLVDTFKTLNESEEGQGTFSGFKGKTNGPRIDFLFSTDDLKVEEAEIVRREFDGKNPSDHYPVTSVLSYADEN